MLERWRRWSRDPALQRWRLPIIALVLAVVVLVLRIDDWGRDFTTNVARISEDTADARLRPLVTRLSADELLEAIRFAGSRIRDWEYVGTAREGGTSVVLFVRTNRLLRFKDDISLIVEDRGATRLVRGESRSRVGFGDLGQNPRNLDRLLRELEDVLRGANRPIPFYRGSRP